MITSLEDFSWLVGVWVGEDGDHIFEEHWSPLRGSSMMGMFRLIQEGQPRFFEFMTLGIEGNECMLRIKHFDPRLIGWEDRDLSVVYSLEESIPGRALRRARIAPRSASSRPGRGRVRALPHAGGDLCPDPSTREGRRTGDRQRPVGGRHPVG